MRFSVLVCLLASALVVSASQLQPFKQGHTYTYRFRTQVSSSLLAEQPSMIQQQAATGMQAQLKLSFTNDRHARVQLQEMRLGEMNGQVQGGQQQLIPTEMFEKRELPEEMKQKLETPFTISLVDGVVERINFQDSESSWTKNIKRAAINMLQLNLKRNDVQGLNMKSSQPQDEREQRNLAVFSIPEITLEGECETHYTIQNRNSRFGRDEEQSLERENQQQQFNVTKNINFNKCQKTADVAYGFQPNAAQQLRCHKCLKQTEIKPQSVGKTEQQEQLKLNQCQMECQTNQLTNNKNIERTTVQQFELYGTTQKYAIRRSRVISQYVVKAQNPEAQNTVSQVVAISELTLKEQSDDNTPVPNVEKLEKDETLLYVPEWDLNERRFYMWGDEEFDPKRTPFSKVQGKPEQAEKFVAEILKQWAEDKEMGYELTSAITFNKLVQLVRQSTVAELKQIEQRVLQAVSQIEGRDDEKQSQEHAKTLFLDALATAATRNSLHELVHKIKNNQVSSPKAAQLIKIFIANQHSPSDRQADLLEQITNCEAAQQCPMLKQTAWLAFGSAVGKICQQQPGQSQKDWFRVEELCPETKKDQYKKTLIAEWKQADRVYEQILALKVIGNSALEKVLPELQNIITDKRQPTLIRMEAIDALRRLRTSMPEKMQQILLPIFQDQREQPEIRMASVSMLLFTQPAPVILDQIVFTVQNDRSQNVRSFVLTAMNSLSQSPAAAEQHIAQHLKAALKIVKITPEQMRMSRRYQVPIYVSEQENTEEQNIFLGLASIVSPSNMIPVHLATSIRAAFNGDATQEKIRLSFSQKDLEQLYEKLTNIYEKYQNEDGEQQERESAKELRNVYSTLGIKSRRHGSYYLSNEGSDEESSETVKRSSKLGTNSPFGMIVLRTNDQDQAIIPIDEQKMPAMLRKFLNNEKSSFNLESYQELRSALAMGRRFQQHIAMSIGETKVKLPTTAGLPLAIIWQVSGVASVQGKIQAKLHLDEQKVEGELKLRTSGIASHLHKTEVWTPVLVSGIQTVRTVELNHGEVLMKVRAGQSKVEITIEPPKQEQKERILGLHTLPATYTQRFNWQTRTYAEHARLRTIRNFALEHLQREYHASQQHQTAIRVEGNVHQVQSFKDLITALYTTENNVHVYFKQGQETPNQVTLRLSGFSFRRSEQGEHSQPEFNDFYSKSSKRQPFRSIYEDREDEQEYKEMGFQNHEDRESRLTGQISKYQFSKAYKHQLKAELEVRTPAKTHTAEIQLQGTCDQGLQHCKAIVNAQRTPYGQEQSNWAFQGKIQSVLPENIRGGESPEEKQSRLVVKAEAEWGAGSQQNNVHVRVQGEPTRRSYWRSESKDWSSFLNKFDLVAEYNLQRPQRHMIQRAYECLKAKYYWDLETQSERKGDENTVRASFVIDPVSRRHANLTVQTPLERVRVQMMELPIRVQGYSLERRQSSYHSFGQLMQSYTQQGAECQVDDRRVKTFDGVSYRSPMGSCWSVLAKDCRENPRFIVLMKKTEGEKKVKVITQENVIEIQKEESKRLVVKVDGQKVTDEERLSEYGIEKSEHQIYVQQKGITVRFNGEEAFIKLSNIYKNIQCGLCGHYSEEENDVFRTNENRRSQSLKDFHKSYALKNEECDDNKLNKFYQDRDSQEFQIKPRKQQSAYYRDSFQRQDDEKSSEQFWTSSEESKEGKQGQQKPVDQTATLEYSQKICFSMKPVKKCPRNSVPDDSEPKSVKVQFFCLNRSTTEARQLQRQVRQGKIVSSEGQQPSFFDNIELPNRCQPAEFY